MVSRAALLAAVYGAAVVALHAFLGLDLALFREYGHSPVDRWLAGFVRPWLPLMAFVAPVAIIARERPKSFVTGH